GVFAAALPLPRYQPDFVEAQPGDGPRDHGVRQPGPGRPFVAFRIEEAELSNPVDVVIDVLRTFATGEFLQVRTEHVGFGVVAPLGQFDPAGILARNLRRPDGEVETKLRPAVKQNAVCVWQAERPEME